ncbi:MAG: polyhydroxyalkanoic acid system family protein [Candidatus Ratteibacteria bacterium]|jgi:hypothetical protein
MSTIDITVAHCFSQDEALRRTRGLLERIQKQFAGAINDLQQEWNGNTGTFGFSVMGLSISGKLYVEPSEVKLTADLPFAAVFFKDKIESVIREQLENL